MVSFSDGLSSGDWLKAANFEVGDRLHLTITSGEVQREAPFGVDRDTCPEADKLTVVELTFEDGSRMTARKSNLNRLSEIIGGTDTDNIPGTEVEILVENSQFGPWLKLQKRGKVIQRKPSRPQPVVDDLSDTESDDLPF